MSAGGFSCNYGCTNAFHHGSTCKNKTTVRLDIAEQKILQAIQSDLFKPEHFQAFKAAVHRQLQQARAARLTGDTNTKRHLADIDREITSLVQAIEDG